MDKKKAKEILELNVKEAGKSMPPDVKDALEVAIKSIDTLIQIEEHGSHILTKEKIDEMKN
ncbi:hypothetical protein ES703_56962 [subsurface metagenome]